METLPAIVIGGPPHSGKSVLVYHLSQALRNMNVAHYVLRAAPDGEGDWYHEIEPHVARTLRYKHEYTPEFVDHMCQVLRNRHLPLLVDMGGRPSREQERILDVCTHAILLTPDAEARQTWWAMMERHALPVIADLHSQLEGEDHLLAEQPVLRGVITGLERHQARLGVTFQALVRRVAQIMDYSTEELAALHMAMAPVHPCFDLEAWIREQGRERWQSDDLPPLLKALPRGEAVALYGRAPNYVYGAVALHTWPADFWQFDVRLGWISPPVPEPGRSPNREGPPGLDVSITPRGGHSLLTVNLKRPVIEPEEIFQQAWPLVERGENGLIISGKMPHWLLTGLVRAYGPLVAWTAVHQPPLGEGGEQAVVVGSQVEYPRVGDIVRL